MERSRVSVLYSHALFGKGIAKLLARDGRLDVHCRRQDDEWPLVVDPVGLDALVIEGCEDPELVARMIQALPPIPVTVVHIGSNHLDVYRDRRLVDPAPASLIESILGAPRGPSSA